MNLTPREKDKMLIAMAAMVARRRLERGVKLNHPGGGGADHRFHPGRRARRQNRRRPDAGRRPRAHARAGDDGIPEMIHDIQVEATFPDGTKLVTVHDPIR